MIGHDESADLFLARDLADNSPVRVRLFRPEAFSDRDSLLAAMHSLAKALEWKYPGAISIREAGIDNDRLYVVSDRPHGAPLRDRLLAGDVAPLPVAANILDQALAVIDAAVIAGINHPGLTPENIFVNPYGAVEVADLGLPNTLALRDKEAACALQTRAPEMTAGRSASAAEQAYAAGALLLWLVSGRPPFAGNTAEQVLRRHRSRLAPSLATLAPAAPDSLVKLVARCLRKDPAGRPTTVGQLREALSQAASEAVWPTRLPSKDIQGEVRQEGKPHWWQRGVLRVFAPRPS